MSDMIAVPAMGRDIETVTSEICIIKDQTQRLMVQSAIEIGRRLTEAKAMVPHGEWGNYLREKVDFSQSTANNMMRIAEEYGTEQVTIFGVASNSQALANLSYTKALRLLALPENERETFLAEQDVEHMSTRELERAIRERDEAKENLQSTEERLCEVEQELEEMRGAQEAAWESEKRLQEQLQDAEKRTQLAAERMEKARLAEQKAKHRLEELKKNPEIPTDVMERVRQEAKEQADQEAEAAVKEARSEQEKAAAEVQAAKKEAEEIARRLETAEKQVKAANPQVTAFKLWFERVQEDYRRMQDALGQVTESDPETGTRLQAAVSALLNQWKEESK